MTFAFIVFAAIIVLGPLVALHEWGHFWVARKLGVKVLTYSIGFGPVLWKRIGKDGIDYRLSAIPLGGYVRMLDEREGEVAEEEKHLAFNNQKPWKKIAIVAAGPIMNFIIAIVLFWVLLLPANETLNTKIGKLLPETPAAKAGLMVGDKVTSVDNKTITTWKDVNYIFADAMGETKSIPVVVERNNEQLTKSLQVSNFLNDQSKDVFEQVGFLPYVPEVKSVIANIEPNSAADNQGLKVGDAIQKIDGNDAIMWDDMSRIVRDNPEKLLQITVLRAGNEQTLPVMPQGKKDTMGNEYGQLGIQPDTSGLTIPDEYKQTISYNPIQAFAKAVEQTWDISVMTITSMGKMLSGLIGLESLSGPITIAKVAGDSMSIGWQAVLSFMALLSVSLAVLNLLPIPVLDGGHILYYTYELITGKPLPEKVQMMGLNAGLMIMLMFMIVAIGNDISRIF